MTMVSNWFLKKRGRALGIMTAGQGMGGLVLSPLTIFLIANLGWRMAWAGIGLLTWIVMIPSALFLAKQKPEIMGLAADGAKENYEVVSATRDNMRVPHRGDEYSLRDILRVPTFWLIALLFPLYFFGHLSIFQHDFALFVDMGIPVVTAGTMLGVLGLFSLSGKIALGYLSDKMSVRHVMMIALVLAAASIFPLIFAEPTVGAWLFIIFWGFWECGVVALQPIMIAKTFNRAIIGRMLGILTAFTVFPQLIGPAFMGYVFDITGSYNLALFVIVIFYLASLVMVFFTGAPKSLLSNYHK
jgi:sugar phosphate permease